MSRSRQTRQTSVPDGRRRDGSPVWRLLALLAGVLVFAGMLVSPAAIRAQDAPTSTPDAEGNIYYEVQPNDSLWSIAARSGLSLQELLDLNQIEETAVVNPGDLLLIGRGEPPATPTSDIPTPTRPPPTPTQSPVPVRTAICMLAFHDANQDGQFNSGERLRGGVAFTVFNDQIVIANYITDGSSEPYCLESLAPGTYHVTRSIAPNEVLTTQGDWAMTLTAGSALDLAFGSYERDGGAGESAVDVDAQYQTRVAVAATATPVAATAAGGNLPGRTLIIVLLGIGAFALLLAAAVLLFWFAYGRKRES